MNYQGQNSFYHVLRQLRAKKWKANKPVGRWWRWRQRETS